MAVKNILNDLVIDGDLEVNGDGLIKKAVPILTLHDTNTSSTIGNTMAGIHFETDDAPMGIPIPCQINMVKDNTPPHFGLEFVTGNNGAVDRKLYIDDNGQFEFTKYGVNLFTGTAAEEEITKVFPVELERFFFIDGEEVEAYTTMMKSSSEGIIDDIKSILRLPSLTRGIGDLKSIAEGYDHAIQADNQKQERDAKASDKARNLFGQLSVVRKHISELEGKVESLNERKFNLKEEMEGYQELRLYAEEKINIEGQLKVLEGSVRTSLDTFLFEFSSSFAKS